MKTPAFLAPYVDGSAPVRLFQGLVVGAIATMAIGFGFGGWETGGLVEKKVAKASISAKVSALAPICAERFAMAAKTDSELIVNLNAISSWQRDDHLRDAGWVTFPGGATPDDNVAAACLELIEADFKTD